MNSDDEPILPGVQRSINRMMHTYIFHLKEDIIKLQEQINELNNKRKIEEIEVATTLITDLKKTNNPKRVRRSVKSPRSKTN